MTKELFYGIIFGTFFAYNYTFPSWENYNRTGLNSPPTYLPIAAGGNMTGIVVPILDSKENDKLVFYKPTRTAFPEKRVARIQTRRGEGDLYPPHNWTPEEGIPVPCNWKIYDVDGRPIGLAEPSEDAILTPQTFKESGQLEMDVVWEKGDKGLYTREKLKGVVIKPCHQETWKAIMGEYPREGGTPTHVNLIQRFNKLEAFPIKSVPTSEKVSGAEQRQQKFDVAVFRGGMMSDYDRSHVVTLDGLRYLHVKDALMIRESEGWNRDDVEQQFRRLSRTCHPDAVSARIKDMAEEKAKAIRELAHEKFALLNMAKQRAFLWLATLELRPKHLCIAIKVKQRAAQELKLCGKKVSGDSGGDYCGYHLNLFAGREEVKNEPEDEATA